MQTHNETNSVIRINSILEASLDRNNKGRAMTSRSIVHIHISAADNII